MLMIHDRNCLVHGSKSLQRKRLKKIRKAWMPNSKQVGACTSHLDIPKKLWMTNSLFLVEDSLKDLKEQTGDALKRVSTQSKKIDDSLGDLDKVLKDMKQSDAERDQEFKNLKNDVQSLKDEVPRVSVLF